MAEMSNFFFKCDNAPADLSNSREARQVVFDLFQDLEGFSLDDCKPFSDVTSSLDCLVGVVLSAVVDRQQRMVKINNDTFDLMTQEGVCRSRFTLIEIWRPATTA